MLLLISDVHPRSISGILIIFKIYASLSSNLFKGGYFCINKSIHLKPVVLIIFILFIRMGLFAQGADSVLTAVDSSAKTVKQGYVQKVSVFLNEDRFLNTKDEPVSMKNELRQKAVTQDVFFYLIAFLVLLLAFFKFFYAKYFNNLFRVFFNTSLRQSQLTDQLLQAKLPSLFFNVFFTMTAGLYIYFLLKHFGLLKNENVYYFIFLSFVSTVLIYFVKFITLKFTGWIVGYKDVTDTYIFIVFLINKILGIFLLPFVVVMAFAKSPLADPAVYISLILIGLMFLLRFFRSYGILQHRIKVSRFHFIIYLTGIEILPLLLIYKALMILLGKI